MTRLARPAAVAGGAVLLGALFWLSASGASTAPGIQAMEIDVHGLGMGRYDGRSVYHPAPLSQRIVTDARLDAPSLAPTVPQATPSSAPNPPPPVPSPTVPSLLPSPTLPPLLPTPTVPPLLPTPTVPPLP